MNMDEDVGPNDTNQEMTPRTEADAGATTPEIRVSTAFCEGEVIIVCKLRDPASGPLTVQRPYVVTIVNGRRCVGDDPKVEWAIGRASGELAPNGIHIHTMVDDEETLELYYDECGAHEQRPDASPARGLTPRVTINLIKSRNE